MEKQNDTMQNGKVSFISKIAYGFGDVGYNFSWSFVVSFLMIFYTDVFGVEMSAVATLMLVSRFIHIAISSMTFAFTFLLGLYSWFAIMMFSLIADTNA